MHLRQSRRCSLHLIDCVWPNKNEVHARLAARVKEGGRLALLCSNTEECGRLALLCSNTGSMWATRPLLQQHRFNVGESPTFAATQENVGDSPTFAATQENVGDSPSFAATQGQCGRLALLCSNTGSMWASRPPLQQHRVNVGESPTLLSRQWHQQAPLSSRV